MPDSADFLRIPQFWRFYVRLEEAPQDGEFLKRFGTTTINGKPYAESTVSLPCGQECFLDLTITPGLAMLNLDLCNIRTNHSREMGWWDDGRWHQFALRWSELQSLHQYWLDHAFSTIAPSAAFLLLAPFVGHGADEREFVPARKDVVAEHYQRLNLFTPGEVAELTEHTVVLPSEEDYRWSQDSELGWVFGGEYPCYSIRNREHLQGAEGRFPFADWASILAQLPPAGSDVI